METVITKILSFCLAGILISIACNYFLLRYAKNVGVQSKNNFSLRWSKVSKPTLGGVAFFIAFLICSLLFEFFLSQKSIFTDSKFIGLFVSGLLAFLMGLTDDAYNTRPYSKLIVQILCGFILVFTHTTIQLTGVYSIDLILTIFWVIVVMNSLNMLDNMDGITGSTVFFILLSCLFSHWIVNGIDANIWSITLVSMLGAIIGFLRYNVHPSRLFMGDAGSQFIGLFVAYFGIEYLWNIDTKMPGNGLLSIVVILTAFTPAAVDTLTVVINRLKMGKSPMVGGKDHTTHHLVYSGLNDLQVFFVFLLIGTFSFLLSVCMIFLIQNGFVLPNYFFILYFLLVFYLLYRNTLRFQPKK